MKRKILFMPQDREVEELYALASRQSKLCLVVWAYEYSEKYVVLFEEYSDDTRVRTARDAAYVWAKGEMKMPEARQYILAAHKAAAESGNEIAEVAGRAVAHAAATVHSARHAFGLVLYGLTALAKLYGKNSREVKEEIKRLYISLEKISVEQKFKSEKWAEFLVREYK